MPTSSTLKVTRTATSSPSSWRMASTSLPFGWDCRKWVGTVLLGLENPPRFLEHEDMFIFEFGGPAHEINAIFPMKTGFWFPKRLFLKISTFQIGVVSAFINSNLKLEPLAHSIRVASSKSILTSPGLLPSESPSFFVLRPLYDIFSIILGNYSAKYEGLDLNSVFDAGLLPRGEQTVFLNAGESKEHRILEAELANVSDTEPRDRGIHFQSELDLFY